MALRIIHGRNRGRNRQQRNHSRQQPALAVTREPPACQRHQKGNHHKHRRLREARKAREKAKACPQPEPRRPLHILRQIDQPAQAEQQQMRGPGPRRRKVDAIREKRPSPCRPPGHTLAKAAPRNEKDGNAGERVDQAVEYMDGRDRRARVNAEDTEKSRHDEGINRRHDRRGLVGIKRAAEALAGQQSLRPHCPAPRHGCGWHPSDLRRGSC